MSRVTKGSVLAVIATVVLAVALGFVLAFGVSHPEADRPAVKTYYETIKPLTVEGGRIVQQEIKPSLSELDQARPPSRAFRQRVASWIRAFERIRFQFAQTRRVSRLKKAAALYDEAFAQYLRAFSAFGQAASKPVRAERAALLKEGERLAEAADKRYDAARSALKRVMLDVGLPVPADFALHAPSGMLPTVRNGRNTA